MQNIGLNTEQPFKSGHSLWFQNSKPPLSWGFQDNLPKKAGCPLRKQPVNSPYFEILTDPRTEKAAGLVHLDARWYNPYTSRFLQPDFWNFASTGLPAEVHHEVVQSTQLTAGKLLQNHAQQQRFGYATSNALNQTDLTGLNPCVFGAHPVVVGGCLVGSGIIGYNIGDSASGALDSAQQVQQHNIDKVESVNEFWECATSGGNNCNESLSDFKQNHQSSVDDFGSAVESASNMPGTSLTGPPPSSWVDPFMAVASAVGSGVSYAWDQVTNLFCED